MKKLTVLLLVLTILLMLPFSVSALDVYDSDGDY